MDFSTIVIRILLAALMGGLIGFEREIHGRAAGFRTHMLVSVGSALFMATSLLIALEYGKLGPIDPSRIASGVVTGVGFLGAGAVMRYKSYVQGLTTAASIWTVSAIGLATGGGLYAAAMTTTVVVLVVLLLSRLERRLPLKKFKDRSEEDGE